MMTFFKKHVLRLFQDPLIFLLTIDILNRIIPPTF